MEQSKPGYDELYRDYVLDGMTFAEIAKKYRVVPGTVGKWLKKQNIPARMWTGGWNKIPMPAKEKLLEDYIVNRFTLSDMAKKYNASRRTVSGWLKQYGIPLRSAKDYSHKRSAKDYSRIPTKEELYEDYVINRLTLVQIGEKHNVSGQTVGVWLRKYNISVRSRGGWNKTQVPSKEELYEDYAINYLTLAQIGEKYSVFDTTVARWLKEYDIPVRSRADYSRMPKMEQLYKEYIIDKLTCAQIAKKYNVADSVVGTWLKRYNIPTRSTRKKIPVPTKEELYNDYVVDELPWTQLSKKYSAPNGVIWKWLKEYDIPLRTVGCGRRMPTKEELYEDYIVNKHALRDIMKEYSVSRTTVKDWLKRYDMPLRSKSDYSPIPEREKLYKEYIVDMLTCAQIGKKYGVSGSEVWVWLKKYDIPLRSKSDYSPIPEREKLYKEYIVDMLTCAQIGEKYGVSEATIGNWLKKCGIPLRAGGKGHRTSTSSSPTTTV